MPVPSDRRRTPKPVNPDLARLQSYPFQKLNALLAGVAPAAGRELIPLHIGEPKHSTPSSSGFVAGDAEILKQFLLYRTYQGCAMSPPVHAASIAAWKDEAHVADNRRLYREKFAAVLEVLRPAFDAECLEAAWRLRAFVESL